MSLSITVSHRTETVCNTKNLSIKYVSSVAHSTETDCNTKKKLNWPIQYVSSVSHCIETTCVTKDTGCLDMCVNYPSDPQQSVIRKKLATFHLTN